MSEWVSSLHAIKKLRKAGLTNPEQTLAQWAEAGLIKARAQKARFGADEGEETIFPKDTLEKNTWPDIPTYFWEDLNKGGQGSEAYFEAGTFAAIIKDIDDTHSEHIKLFNVSFKKSELLQLIEDPLALTAKPSPSTRAGRRPDVKKRDTFCAILAVELYGMGLKKESIEGINRSGLQATVENCATKSDEVFGRGTMDDFIDQVIERLKKKYAKNCD